MSLAVLLATLTLAGPPIDCGTVTYVWVDPAGTITRVQAGEKYDCRRAGLRAKRRGLALS